MNPLDAFTRKAKDYAAYRLPYVDQAFTDLVNITHLSTHTVVADIGSGTGTATKHILPVVDTVFAVEPNAAMRQEAENMLSQTSGFESVDATAEKTTLPSKRIDLILIGQAYHWFDHERVEKELRRILVPNGWVALIWNHFGSKINDFSIPHFLAEDQLIYRSYPTEVKEGWQNFIGGLRSSAVHPNIGDPTYPAFENKYRAYFETHAIDDLITVRYSTELVIGKLMSI